MRTSYSAVAARMEAATVSYSAALRAGDRHTGAPGTSPPRVAFITRGAENETAAAFIVAAAAEYQPA